MAFDKKEGPVISIPLRPALLLAGFALGSTVPHGASAQAPDEDWKTLSTEHVRVTYPVDLRDLATLVADRAERAYGGLARDFEAPPNAAIDVVLTDTRDTSNGFARVAPWNRIVLYAPPPMEGFELAYFDDWVELVVTHEMAHIFHLDSRGWLGSAIRAVFGRAPVRWPIFPNSALPGWTIEGLATYYESELTDAGRVKGTFNDMALRTAVLEGEFERLNQVSGQSQVWPAGNRPYIYGSLFFDYLTREYGQESMGQFTAAVDRQIIPFRMNAAARASFGLTFKEAFGDWARSLDARYALAVSDLERRAPITDTEPLATTGRWALYPRVSPDGTTVAFARSDGATDAQIHIMDPAGGGGGKLVRANGLSLLDWTPDGQIVFSQTEFVDPYRSFKDLYRVDASGGGAQRITHGARLDYPSVSPDGTSALAVRQARGLTWIVSVDLRTGEIERLIEPTDNVHWAYPTWSPDGELIAVSRWEPGAFYDLLILDRSGRVLDQVTSDRAIDLAPTWSPNGRHVLWASDRTGIPNIFAAEIGSDGRVGRIRQVTNLATGASYPDVDPGSGWLYMSTYHADGWHVERTRYDPERWFEPAPTDVRFLSGGEDGALGYEERIESPETPYNPFPSLWPRYWEPSYRQGETTAGVQVLGPAYGLQTTAIDLVERHAVTAALRYEPKGSRLEGGLAYSFFGLGNPVLSLVGEQSYSSFGISVTDPVENGQPDPPARSVFFLERERELSAQVSLLRRRTRDALSLTLGGAYVWENQELLNDQLEPDTVFSPTRPTSGLPQINATLGFNTTRTHPFSISREDGVSGFARGRRRWDVTVPDSLSGSINDRSWADVTGELRAYKSINLPGFSRHVLSVRASGGAAWDSGAGPGFYSVGGAAGQAERITGLELLSGNNLLFPVRGFDPGIRRGARAWSASAEYRFPLARINRALGDFPLYFDWISGSLFVDAGNAWGPSDETLGFQNSLQEAVASAGAELMVNGLPLWTSATALRAGLAFPVRAGTGTRFYLRLGAAF